jgi:hypothetical protein
MVVQAAQTPEVVAVVQETDTPVDPEDQELLL